MQVPSRDSADMYIALPVATMAATCRKCTGVKLVLHGFAKVNEEGSGRCHKLERCRFFEPLAALPHESPRDLVHRLATWLARVVVTTSSDATRRAIVPPLTLPPGGFNSPSAESAWLEARLSELKRASYAASSAPFGESNRGTGSTMIVVAGSAGDLALAAFQQLVLCTGSLGHALQLVDLLLSAQLSSGQSDSGDKSSTASSNKCNGSRALAEAAESLEWLEEKANKTMASTETEAIVRATVTAGAWNRLQFQVHGRKGKATVGKAGALDLTKGGRGLRATALRYSLTAYLPLQLPDNGSATLGRVAWSLTLGGDAVDGLWLGVGRLGSLGGPGPDLNAVQSDATAGHADEEKDGTENDGEEPEWSVRWLVEVKTGKLREEGREGDRSSFLIPTMPKAGPGDVVSFELDQKVGTLSYCVNAGAAVTMAVWVGGGVVPVVEVAPCSPSRATLAASSFEGGLVREVKLDRLDVLDLPRTTLSAPATESQQTSAPAVTYLAGQPCVEQGAIRSRLHGQRLATEEKEDSSRSATNSVESIFHSTENNLTVGNECTGCQDIQRQVGTPDERAQGASESSADAKAADQGSREGRSSPTVLTREFEKVISDVDEIIGRFGEAPKVRRPERKAGDEKLSEFIVTPVHVNGLFYPQAMTMAPYDKEHSRRTSANGHGSYATWTLGHHGVDRFESIVSADQLSSFPGSYGAWLTFSVFGDGVEIWSSKRLSVHGGTSDYASISLRGCTELELRVHVEASEKFEEDLNQGELSALMFAATIRAVWQQPVLISDMDANDPLAPLLCNDETSSTLSSASPSLQTPLPRTAKRCAPASLMEAGQRILGALGELATGSRTHPKGGCLALSVEATAPVMSRLGKLLSALVRWQPPTTNSAAAPSVDHGNEVGNVTSSTKKERACRLRVFTGTEAERDAALLATLRLCRANISRLPESAALEEHNAWLPPMRTAIETLMASDTGACGSAVQGELSSLIEEGLPLLYPSPSDVARLLLDLLRRCQAQSQLSRRPESNASSTSTGLKGVRVALLEQLLQRLSSPGEEELLGQVMAHVDPNTTIAIDNDAATRPTCPSEESEGSGVSGMPPEGTVLVILMESSATWHDALATLSVPIADDDANSLPPGPMVDASEAPKLEKLANAARGLLAKVMYLSLITDDGLESWGDDGEDDNSSSAPREVVEAAPATPVSEQPLGGGVEESKTEDSAQEEKTSPEDASAPILPPPVDPVSPREKENVTPPPPSSSVLTPACFGGLLLRHCEQQLSKARAVATGSNYSRSSSDNNTGSGVGQPAPALARALVQQSACATLLPAFTAAALGRAGLPSPLAAALLPPMVALVSAADHLIRTLEDLADEEHGGESSSEEEVEEKKSGGWLVEPSGDSSPSGSSMTAWEEAYTNTHASKMRSTWAKDLKWGGHSGLGGGCLGASTGGANDGDNSGGPTAPLLFNGSLHGAHVILGDGRRTVTNRHRNAFSNAVCDLPGLTSGSNSSRRGRSEPRGILTGRHELSWRVLTSAPSDDCGLGVGLLAVGAPAPGAPTNRPQPVTLESPAFAADSYLVRVHCAWMFECGGTRFHDAETEAGGAAVEYGRPWRVGDVVTVIVDLDASSGSPPGPSSSPESAGTGHGRGTVR